MSLTVRVHVVGIAAIVGLWVGLCFVSSAGAAPKKGGRAGNKARVDDQALLKSGQAHARASEWPQAVADFKSLVRLRPKDSAALCELSMALLMTNQLDPAQRTAEQAVKFAGGAESRATALYTLGRVVEARGKAADALGYYTKSQQLNASDETTRRIYMLDEFTELVPCRSARSIEAICSCLNNLLGGACAVEDDIQPTVKKLRSSWAPEGRNIGSASAFLAVQSAGGWFLVAHLGRLRNAAPRHLIVTDMRAEVQKVGERQVYKIEYTYMDNDASCGTLSGREVKGLGREYQLECLREDRHVLGCASSADERSVDCKVDMLTSCKHGKSGRIHDEFAGLSKSTRAAVRSWEARSQSTGKGQLSLTERGTLSGTAMTVGGLGQECPKAKSVDLHLW